MLVFSSKYIYSKTLVQKTFILNWYKTDLQSIIIIIIILILQSNVANCNLAVKVN